MFIFKNKILPALVAVAMVFAAACSRTGSEQSSTYEHGKEKKPAYITVSAASSLKEVMEEIKAVYKKERPKVSITYNFGSSGSLQQQIEQGAQVDIFVPAAVKHMDVLKNKGLIIEETKKEFLKNRMVLIVPQKPTTIADFKDISGDMVKRVGMGEPKSVPAGQYADEILKNLGIIDLVKPKAVYGKDVKEVLMWVETGNVDAGIVYETDAKVSDKVRVVAKAPEGSHDPIYYPAAVLNQSKNIDAAGDFINFIYSSKAKPVFEKYGFEFLIG